jgi:hypothetical protein
MDSCFRRNDRRIPPTRVTTGRAEGRSPYAFLNHPPRLGAQGVDSRHWASEGGFRGHDEAWPSKNPRGFPPPRE